MSVREEVFDARALTWLVGVPVLVVGVVTGAGLLASDYFSYVFIPAAVGLLVAVAAPGRLVELVVRREPGPIALSPRSAVAMLAILNAWSWFAVSFAAEFRHRDARPQAPEAVDSLALGVAFVLLASVLRSGASRSGAATSAVLGATGWMLVQVQATDTFIFLPLASWLSFAVIAVVEVRSMRSGGGQTALDANRWLAPAVTMAWATWIVSDPDAFARIRWIVAFAGALGLALVWGIRRRRSA